MCTAEYHSKITGLSCLVDGQQKMSLWPTSSIIFQEVLLSMDSSPELNPYLFTPFLVRQQLGFSPSLVAPAPSTTDISDLGQSLGFSLPKFKWSPPDWARASALFVVGPRSPSPLVRPRVLDIWQVLNIFPDIFTLCKYQQRLCFILFVNSLSIGWFAWDSASMRRIESAFFKRVRRSSGDRSSTWVQLIVYNIYTIYYILYILGRINPAIFSQ